MQNIYQPSETTYLKAKALLTNDQLVAFPTETIYGLGANALSDGAAKKIFELKGRPNDNPLIVHLGEKSQISDYAFIENEIQQKIIDKLMPWPITLLLKKKENISPIVCPVPLVGIRLPSNEIAQKMLTTVGVPIAAPSANISGKASPTNAQMVYDNLWEKVPMIIDGGESEAGIESTVVRVVSSDTPSAFKILILRPWFVTKEDLEECFDGEIEVEYTQNHPELSPGMRYKHYSISGQVKLIEDIEDFLQTTPPPYGHLPWQGGKLYGNKQDGNVQFTPLSGGEGGERTEQPVPHKLRESGSEDDGRGGCKNELQKIGYLITQEFFDQNQPFFSALSDNTLVKIRGTHKNLATCAHHLFDRYHYFDQQGVDVLYVEKLPEVGIGYSIMNRVKRSAEVH